jgi:hypothetical protein
MLLQLVVATVLQPDVTAYMEYIKTLSSTDGSSTSGSDFR